MSVVGCSHKQTKHRIYTNVTSYHEQALAVASYINGQLGVSPVADLAIYRDQSTLRAVGSIKLGDKSGRMYKAENAQPIQPPSFYVLSNREDTISLPSFMCPNIKKSLTFISLSEHLPKNVMQSIEQLASAKIAYIHKGSSSDML